MFNNGHLAAPELASHAWRDSVDCRPNKVGDQGPGELVRCTHPPSREQCGIRGPCEYFPPWLSFGTPAVFSPKMTRYCRPACAPGGQECLHPFPGCDSTAHRIPAIPN